METKTLHRVEQGKMVGGVCTGLAKYFNIDPTVIRLIFIILFLLGSSGLLIYFILWVLMPADTMQVYSNQPESRTAKEDKVVIDSQDPDHKVE